MNRSYALVSNYVTLQPCIALRMLGGYLFSLWLLGIILNGNIIWMFLRNRKLRQSPSNVFVMGLIVTDMMAIVFEVPMAILSTLSCR